MNRRRAVFALITVTATSVLTLIIAEYVLRLQTASIRSSDVMDPGLIGYDRLLGWRLQKNWRGTHRHHDFSVSYRTNPRGFRGPWFADQDRQRLVLLGDSFTFGLGVNDEDTFARGLQRRLTDDGIDVVNLGVPGYSTDQELLLIEDLIDDLEPTHVVLVVCLINDVFDNDREFPLQARHGKPRYTLDDSGELVLTNVPVPLVEKQASETNENLASLVMDDFDVAQNRVSRWLGRQEINRRLGWFQPEFSVPKEYFKERFRASLALFDALTRRAREVTDSAGSRFQIVLLPGRSCVEIEGGYSAQYQDFLRRAITAQTRSQSIEFSDLTDPLRKTYQEDGLTLFHAHDGHLNVRGHAVVASMLHRTTLDASQDAGAWRSNADSIDANE